MKRCRKLYTAVSGAVLSLALILQTGMDARAVDNDYLQQLRGGEIGRAHV